MSGQFSKGNVQSVLDRIAVLAAQFDDDGEMDVWGFGEKHKKYPNVTLDNFGHIYSVHSRGWKAFSLGEPAGPRRDKQRASCDGRNSRLL